jgi:hypothetical protein
MVISSVSPTTADLSGVGQALVFLVILCRAILSARHALTAVDVQLMPRELRVSLGPVRRIDLSAFGPHAALEAMALLAALFAPFDLATLGEAVTASWARRSPGFCVVRSPIL